MDEHDGRWGRMDLRWTVNLMKGALALLVILLIQCVERAPVWARGIPEELLEMDIEQLMNVEVSSISRKEQKLSDTAAAVFVITQDDIRRSGATSIPEVLRMAPGVQVARIDANKWAVSCRGFNGLFTNKLLVLIDGRTVYSPLFAGVFWDVQDTMLEDIERIEVIRGPGASLWGANAVNGIISIVTKHAQDTQGGLVSAGSGNEERAFGAVRFGGKVSEGGFYRGYAKYFNRDDGVFASGERAADGWDQFRTGFRTDWVLSDRDRLTVQGDIYKSRARETARVLSFVPPFEVLVDDDNDAFGGNLLTRWSRTFSPTSNLSLQVYYDRTERSQFFLSENRDTFDMDFQHRFLLMDRQDIVWGLGYRVNRNDTESGPFFSMDPEGRTDQLLSGFIQDDITLVRDRLHLVLGSKMEQNDQTGFEVQPSARLLYTPGDRHTIWASVSRAVRTPSEIERDARIDVAVLPPNGLITVFGNDDLLSEELVAYELGYRVQATSSLSIDVATFFNDYDKLVSFEPGVPFFEPFPPPGRLVVPLLYSNEMDGESYGVEVAADWRVLKWWRLQAAYTFLKMHLHSEGVVADLNEVLEGTSPEHQMSLRSTMNLTKDIDFDVWLRSVDKLSTLDVSGYTTLDLRLAWRPRPDLELSLVGQNLLDSRHLEFLPEFGTTVVSTESQRGVYGKITFRF